MRFIYERKIRAYVEEVTKRGRGDVETSSFLAFYSFLSFFNFLSLIMLLSNVLSLVFIVKNKSFYLLDNKMSKTLKQHYRFLLFSFPFSCSFEYNFTFLYNFSKIYLSFYHLNVEQNHKVCTRWRSETSMFIKFKHIYSSISPVGQALQSK